MEVVVIGGGASGVLTAARLLDASCARPVRVRVVERSGRAGAGVAYGTADPDHLLNVRAGGMSADPSDPGELARWAETRGLGGDGDFLPRHRYHAYLQDHLARAAAHADHGDVELVPGTALGIDLSGTRPEVLLATGRRVRADRVVLASGNAPPGTPGPLRALAGHPAWIADPWADGALDRARRGGEVLLLGSGLTMVDVAITLARGGGPGMVALSRRGLLPRAHRPDRGPVEVAVVDLARDAGDLLGLARRIRALAGDGPGGADWRDVVDSVRPFVNALWQRAGHAERRAFLVHLSRWWDVHRHRMSPPTAARLAALLAGGQLANRRGHVVAARAERGRPWVEVRVEGRTVALRPDVVVNCTGPGRGWQEPVNPVVADLVRRGAAVPDAHGLGLATTAEGHLLGRGGVPVPAVLVIGPPRRGTLYETTAIPELRSQALHIADQVVVGGPGQGVAGAGPRAGAASASQRPMAGSRPPSMAPSRT